MKNRKIPNFAYEAHPDITIDQFRRLEDAVAIFECDGQDTDGHWFFCYTVGGQVDGEEVAVANHATKQAMGALVEGDLIVVHAKRREEADEMAMDGIFHTQALLAGEFAARGTVEIGPNAGTIAGVETKSVRH
jgi:hypothetical protein